MSSPVANPKAARLTSDVQEFKSSFKLLISQGMRASTQVETNANQRAKDSFVSCRSSVRPFHSTTYLPRWPHSRDWSYQRSSPVERCSARCFGNSRDKLRCNCLHRPVLLTKPSPIFERREPLAPKRKNMSKEDPTNTDPCLSCLERFRTR